MLMKIKRDPRLVDFEKCVVDFAAAGGSFLAYSDDAIFNKMLKETIYKQLQIKTECVLCTTDRKMALNYLKLKDKSKSRVLLFMERMIGRSSSLEFIEFTKATFNDVLCIVLTSETEKEQLALLHEAGVDNIITKPLNINTLIEKIAFTVRPQGDIGKLIDAAKGLLDRESFAEALQAAEAILEIKPNSAAGLMIRGDAYKGMLDMAQAVQEYTRAHECAPMYLEPLKRLATLYEEQDDKEKQLFYLDKLDRLSPLNVGRKMNIGGLHMDMGQEEKGKIYYDQAMDVATREAAQSASNVAMDIAERLIGVDPATAEKYYRKALRLKGRHLDRSDVETFNRLGIALRRQKRPKAAITEYTKALALAPDDENLYYNMAMAHLEAGNFEVAMDKIHKVLDINPSFAGFSPVLSFNIGMIYFKNEKFDQAMAAFQHALELEPGYGPAQRMLHKCTG